MGDASLVSATKSMARTHPVIELFGPTIQGEGHLIGTPCYFVRFGGCDYRCSWCDSKYAVNPDEVRENATKMTDWEIIQGINALPGNADLVVLSGGNPALQHLDTLVELLHLDGKRVTVETQGTMWRDWLGRVDHVTVSPKPPSSGMKTDLGKLDSFLGKLAVADVETALKIVVFDHEDLAYADSIFRRYEVGISEGIIPFLSVGNRVGYDSNQDLLDKLHRFVDDCLEHPTLGSRVRFLPQLHVLLYGNARGV